MGRAPSEGAAPRRAPRSSWEEQLPHRRHTPRACAAGLAVAVVGCSDFFVQRQEAAPPPPLRVEQEWRQAPIPEVDVLWVIDDTPSMAGEHLALQDAAEVFIDALDVADLSWQVGVARGSLGGDAPGSLQGNPWVIVPGLSDPAGALAAVAEVGADGAPPRVRSGRRLALTEPLRSVENRGFRRPEAALHVVVFSDADDESGDVLGVDPGAAFLEFLASEEARTGRSARLSAVIGDPGEGCVGDRGQALPGDTYAWVAAESGGAVSSICQPDLPRVLAGIGDASAEWPRSFPLDAVPAVPSMRVRSTASVSSGWTVALAPPPCLESPPGDAVLRASKEIARRRRRHGRHDLPVPVLRSQPTSPGSAPGSTAPRTAGSCPAETSRTRAWGEIRRPRAAKTGPRGHRPGRQHTTAVETLTLPPFDLSDAVRPVLAAPLVRDDEAGFGDVGRLEARTAGWVPVEPTYGYPAPGASRVQAGWHDTWFDLGTLGPSPTLRLVLDTDLSLTAAGWYLGELILFDVIRSRPTSRSSGPAARRSPRGYG